MPNESRNQSLVRNRSFGACVNLYISFDSCAKVDTVFIKENRVYRAHQESFSPGVIMQYLGISDAKAKFKFL